MTSSSWKFIRWALIGINRLLFQLVPTCASAAAVMLRRFLDSRPSLLKEHPRDSGGRGLLCISQWCGVAFSVCCCFLFHPVSILAQNIANVLSILRNQMLKHQFHEAAFTMESISMAMDHVPDVARKV